MREKTHSFEGATRTRFSATPKWTCWVAAVALALLLGLLGALIVEGSIQAGPRWLNELARGDLNPVHRQSVDGLWVTRGLLMPRGAGGETLWLGRQSGAAAGFYLAGAVLAEQRGNPPAARLWLALDALDRGEPARARAWLGTIPAPGPWPDRRQLHEPGWLERSPWGERLRGSIR